VLTVPMFIVVAFALALAVKTAVPEKPSCK